MWSGKGVVVSPISPNDYGVVKIAGHGEWSAVSDSTGCHRRRHGSDRQGYQRFDCDGGALQTRRPGFIRQIIMYGRGQRC